MAHWDDIALDLTEPARRASSGAARASRIAATSGKAAANGEPTTAPAEQWKRNASAAERHERTGSCRLQGLGSRDSHAPELLSGCPSLLRRNLELHGIRGS